jgi:hypothetical protein
MASIKVSEARDRLGSGGGVRRRIIEGKDNDV